MTRLMQTNALALAQNCTCRATHKETNAHINHATYIQIPTWRTNFFQVEINTNQLEGADSFIWQSKTDLLGQDDGQWEDSCHGVWR